MLQSLLSPVRFLNHLDCGFFQIGEAFRKTSKRRVPVVGFVLRRLERVPLLLRSPLQNLDVLLLGLPWAGLILLVHAIAGGVALAVAGPKRAAYALGELMPTSGGTGDSDPFAKLQVGVFIRTGTMNEAAGKATEDLRERLEDLRDALLANEPAKAKQLLPAVEDAYRKCRDCYPQTETIN